MMDFARFILEPRKHLVGKIGTIEPSVFGARQGDFPERAADYKDQQQGSGKPPPYWSKTGGVVVFSHA
jgi:hypothetical protein